MRRNGPSRGETPSQDPSHLSQAQAVHGAHGPAAVVVVVARRRPAPATSRPSGRRRSRGTPSNTLQKHAPQALFYG